MPTSLPVVVSYGDILEAKVLSHNGSIFELMLRSGDILSIHYEGDDEKVFTDLPYGGAKDTITGVVVGDILTLCWSSGGQVITAKWDMALNAQTQPATAVFSGTLPSMAYGVSTYTVHYVSPTGDHEERRSSDGLTFGSAILVEAEISTDTESVSVSIHPDRQFEASWTNTKQA